MMAANQKILFTTITLSVASLSLAGFVYFKYQQRINTLENDIRNIQADEAKEIDIISGAHNSGVYFLTQEGENSVKTSIIAQNGISSGYNEEKKAFVIQIDSPTCSSSQKLIWDKNRFICLNDADNDTPAGVIQDNDSDLNNYTTGITFDDATGELSLSRNGLDGLTVNIDGRYLTSYSETDGVVGNEITDATHDRGLVRSGSGTALNPYTLGINYGSNCSGASSKLLYDGTQGTWTCGVDVDTNTTYSATNQGIALDGTTFGLTLDGSTLSKGTSGLKVNTITSNEISNSTIVDEDISASAGISWNKISKSGGSITDLGAPALSGNAGKVLAVNGTEDGLVWSSVTGGVSGDSLDFTELKDALLLDDNTTISLATYDMIINLTNSGDFKVQDNGVDVLYISDSGRIGVQTTSPSGKVHVVGDMYITGDRHVECDGSTSDEVGNCSAHTEGSAIVALVGSDKICANSATTPTAIRIDSDTDCTNGGGNEGTYLLGKNTTPATTAITSQWAYFDANSSVSYTNGEDIFLDNAPLLTFQSGNLYVDHITLLEPTWDDLRLSGSSLGAGAAAPDQVTWVSASNLKVRGFDGTNTTEMLYFEAQFPHAYKEGSDIHAHVHWGPTTANAGNVKWNMEYSWVNIGDVAPAVTTTSVVQAAGGTAYKHNMVDFPVISGSGKTLSSMLVGRLYRNPTDDADTYAYDAALLEIDFHFQIDGLGSVSETSKD